ncbi:hypothetical protein O3M35_007500 [Rhynocoris fuscipes]|uniref:Zinc transporter ZIP1 n=1 Tax=Rhynocoris fuscipes TaxID=488301 RepID=A0AAW1DCB5_9HEMI
MYTIVDLKLISITLISFGSYFFGVLPNILGLGGNVEDSTPISMVLCFGGGVLFSTSIIHILPDIRKDLSECSEIVFCSGYLLMYLIDVAITTLKSDVSREVSSEAQPINTENSKTYGTSSIETNSPCDDIQSEEPYVQTSSNGKFKDVSLLFAFSLHSLLEGLVIGVETTKSGVILLLAAICSHKLLVAFCLGAELSSGGKPLYAIIPSLSVFVIGSSVGIGLGIFLDLHDSPFIATLSPVLQGLAGGTLLYVVVTEILPRERAKNLPKYSSILQYISLCCGFASMTVLTIFT